MSLFLFSLDIAPSARFYQSWVALCMCILAYTYKRIIYNLQLHALNNPKKKDKTRTSGVMAIKGEKPATQRR